MLDFRIDRPNAWLLAGALVVLVACGDDSGVDTDLPIGGQADASSSTLVGAKSYDKYCGLCHGDQGQGYISPRANALSNPQFLSAATDEFLRIAVRDGRPGTKMSPWGVKHAGPLSDGQVEQLVALMRGWQTLPVAKVHDKKVVGDVQNGGKHYAKECEVCHGKVGEGATALSLNHPIFHASASDGFIRHAIEKGRKGTPMLAYGGTLSPGAIDDIVAFIRSLDTAEPCTAPGGCDQPVCPPGAVTPCDEPTPKPDKCPEITWQAKGIAADFSSVKDLYAPVALIAKELVRGADLLFLDARPPADFLIEHVTGAVSLPFYDGEACAKSVPKDAMVITYCACPHNESVHLAEALQKAGLTKVKVMDEGFIHWKVKGHPVSKGPKHPSHKKK
jgi:rhodanese-related sulfurtransferase/mono/diheme cytochrome c family protein